MDWKSRLNIYIMSKISTPFRWGSNDCVTFTLKGIKEAFKVDVLKQFPRWKTKKEAQAVINALCQANELGKGDLLGLARCYLVGDVFEEIEPVFATNGDLIVAPTKRGPMFCLCINGKLAAPGKNGTVFLPFKGAAFRFKGDR